MAGGRLLCRLLQGGVTGKAEICFSGAQQGRMIAGVWRVAGDARKGGEGRVRPGASGQEFFLRMTGAAEGIGLFRGEEHPIVRAVGLVAGRTPALDKGTVLAEAGEFALKRCVAFEAKGALIANQQGGLLGAVRHMAGGAGVVCRRRMADAFRRLLVAFLAERGARGPQQRGLVGAVPPMTGRAVVDRWRMETALLWRVKGIVTGRAHGGAFRGQQCGLIAGVHGMTLRAASFTEGRMVPLSGCCLMAFATELIRVLRPGERTSGLGCAVATGAVAFGHWRMTGRPEQGSFRAAVGIMAVNASLADEISLVERGPRRVAIEAEPVRGSGQKGLAGAGVGRVTSIASLLHGRVGHGRAELLLVVAAETEG